MQHNERTLRRFQAVELRLIGAQDFASFFDTFTTGAIAWKRSSKRWWVARYARRRGSPRS
jgi:hypothetical protein